MNVLLRTADGAHMLKRMAFKSTPDVIYTRTLWPLLYFDHCDPTDEKLRTEKRAYKLYDRYSNGTYVYREIKC